MAEKIFGTWDLIIDRQNRIVIPTEVYKALDKEYELKLNLHPNRPYIEVRTVNDFNKLHANFLKDKTFSSEIKEKYENFFFGSVENVEIDKSRRLTLPKAFTEKKKISRIGRLVCIGKKIRIWSKDAHEKEQYENEKLIYEKHAEIEKRFYAYDEESIEEG